MLLGSRGLRGVGSRDVGVWRCGVQAIWQCSGCNSLVDVAV